MPAIPRPAADEYNPFFGTYVTKVPAGADILALLEALVDEMEELLSGLDDAGALHRYAPGKWSIKEILGHLADAERVFVVRALAAARGDRTTMPGFEQDDYVAAARFDRHPLADLLAERRLLRRSSLAFFRGLEPGELERRGDVGGHPWTPRAALYTIAGHDLHHLAVLRERYLQRD